MTRIKYIVAVILLILAMSIYFAPRFIDLEAIRVDATESIAAKTGWQVKASRLDFQWWPFPHFTLEQTYASTNGLSLEVPEIDIYPRLFSVIQGKFELSSMVLVDPELWVESLPDNLVGGAGIFPRLEISIVNGYADIKPGVLNMEYPYMPLELSGINAHFSLNPDQLNLKLTSESSLFNFMDLYASFNPSNSSYLMEYSFNGLQLYNLLPAFLEGSLLPVDSAISLNGNIKGRGVEWFKADVEGDFPCFVSPAPPESFLLDCGTARLTIEKNLDDLTIDIDKLELKNPDSLLKGRIARLQEKKGLENPGPPVWLVDLKGEYLDLSAIRKGVMTLWGSHVVTRTVTDIVLGGKARSASYYFRDLAEGFKDIKKMAIKVDIQAARIRPPKTPLLLDNASGPIEIIDGYLSGKDLKADFRNSKGTRCSLLLDLTSRSDEFRLDLDIDAELDDLPSVLYDLIDDEVFRKELMLFKEITGKAKAHLNIGDTLAKPAVTVEVDSVNGGARYDRIGQSFRVREGGFDVLPDKRVNWKDIGGTLGGHLVQETSGEVRWGNGTIINIKSLKGSIDSRKILNDLSISPVYAEKLKNLFYDAEGHILLKSGQLAGPPGKPSLWKYRFELSTSGSRFTSPLLPGPTKIETARFVVTEDNIRLFESSFRHFDEPLRIEGVIDHKFFSGWQGWLMLSGHLNEETGRWLRKKEWIPEKYFPRIPSILDKFIVAWSPGLTGLSGTIDSGPGAALKSSVRLELLSDKEKIEVADLVVVSPDEKGRLSFSYKKDGSGELGIRWQGFVDSVTVGSLLEKNITRAERFEGDFTFQYPARQKTKIFNGWLKVNQLDWLFSTDEHNLVVSEINLTGEENDSVKFNGLLDAMGDEVALNGKIDFEEEMISFAIDLEAAELTGMAVEQVIKDLEGSLLEKDKDKADKKSSVADGMDIKGELRFNITSLSYGKQDEDTEQIESSGSNEFEISPAEGYLTLDSSKNLSSLTLVNSNICGLDISGRFNSESSKYDSYMQVFTGSSSLPFENILPCFGFDNALIDGDIDFSLDFRGFSDKWATGKADLLSDGGYIRKLGFLSKVFRIVNLSDIFSAQKLPDFGQKGFAYSEMNIASHVENNMLVIDKAIIKGEGLNLYGQGKINLADWTADLTVMVAPLKTVDAVLTNIPLIGKVVGGADKAVISIPVSLKGSLRDPDVALLPPGAIGEGLLNLITNTLMMPFQIFSPLRKEKDN